MSSRNWQSVISNTVFWAAQGYLCYREPAAWLIGMTALYLAGGLKIRWR